MTGSNNSTVEITIQVLDADSGAAIQNVETKLASLGAAGLSAGNSLGGMSDKLKSVSSEAASAGGALAGIGSVGAGGLDQLNTGLDGVKGNIREVGGPGREMGLNLDYSMKHAIADNEVLMAGLRSLTGLFVALGVVAVGEQIVKGAEHLYEKWLDVDKAVDDYNQKAAESAQQKLFDTASLETTVALLKQATEEVGQLQAKKDAMESVEKSAPFGAGLARFLGAVGGGFGGEYATGDLSLEDQYSVKDSQTQAQKMADAGVLSQRKITLDDQEAQRQLENQKRHDEAVLTGIPRAAQVQRDEDEITFQKYKALRDNIAATAKTAAPKLHMTEAEVTDLLKNQYNQ